MCGIISYIGNKPAIPILVEGLKRLEYRGYDSSGIAFPHNNKQIIIKKTGTVSKLKEVLNKSLNGYNPFTGIAHTRWATHGGVTDYNAHPHISYDGKIALVHNGIIENYEVLRKKLIQDGLKFNSDTDSEVLCYLINKYYAGDIEKAVKKALSLIEGTYGIAVIHTDEPDTIIGARNGSPLVVGVGNNEMFLASDVNAIIAHTRQVFYLEDGEMVTLKRNDYKTTDITNATVVKKNIHKIDLDLEEFDKGEYNNYMMKEIFEQPKSIERAFAGRLLKEFGTVKLGGLNLERRDYFDIERIHLLACGTSFYAALYGSYILENFARIPCRAETASEFRYRNPVNEKGTLYIVISQSGETADTLSAIKEIHIKGGRVLGIVNVVGSTIARENDGGVYVHSGPEISVASTKFYTSSLTVLSLLAILLGRMNDISSAVGKRYVEEIMCIPSKVRKILDNSSYIESIAEKYLNYPNFLFMARGYNFPNALEGALKLKEISYVHAEGYSAAEMKHGPLALIDENMPVIMICVNDELRSKVISNIEEVKARNGKLIIVATEGDEEIKKYSDDVIYIPDTYDIYSPILTIVPLQLLAYYFALKKGYNVDKPRNLAKSVTVE